MLRAYRGARRRLLVLGYNATLTTAVEAPRQPKRHFDQIKARPAPPHAHTSTAGAKQALVARSAALLSCRVEGCKLHTSRAPVTAMLWMHAGRA